MGLLKLYPRVYIIHNIVQGFDVKTPDTAYERLFHAIEVGEIGPGERLLEIELAQRFGVSRTPIREAIRKLESEGIVRHVPRIGAVIRQLGQPEIVELYDWHCFQMIHLKVRKYTILYQTDGLDITTRASGHC